MDVTKAAAALAAAAGTAAGAPRTGTLLGSADNAQRSALPADDAVAALADRVDIHTLDITSALQILLAEVRVELGLPAGAAVLPGAVLALPLQPPQSAAQAARQLLQMFLQALPVTVQDPVADTGQVDARATRPSPPVPQGEATLRLALDRAVEAVAAWRDVSEPVVDAAKDARALVVTLLSDEPPSPLWLQLEWLSLAPRMKRYWRRRRRAGRRRAR